MRIRFCLRLLLLLLIGHLVTWGVFCAPRPGQETTDYASHFNHGQELFKQMRFHEATAELREAVRLNPEYLPAQQALDCASPPQSWALEVRAGGPEPN